MEIKNIRIRDPFIFVENSTYYLYGSTDENTWQGRGTGFLMYQSKDLEHFEKPIQVFAPSKDFWGEENFWAPEVCKINKKYYMTASFKGKEGRGVQIMQSESLEGPFVPTKNYAITPKNWESLDGTLFCEKGEMYMIFSHEWTQVADGEICIARISKDMTHFVEKPIVLFKASDAEWTIERKEGNKKGYVTDGPFVLTLKNETLAMIWSSYSRTGYSIGASYSKNGVLGPWKHSKKLLYEKDGGHGMIFKTMEGRMFLVIHTPNSFQNERMKLLEVQEINGHLEVMGDKE